MFGSSASAQLICLAITCIVPAFSQTGAWSSPTTLSTGGQGWQSAAAIDGAGNSVAIWDEITGEAQLWSRAKPNNGSWGAVTEVYPALEASSIYPAVQISSAGLATAVWTDMSGAWTADRPPASNWESPQLLVSGISNPIFVMNSQGAAAMVWSVGGPRSTSSQVLAMLRPAGGAWSSQQLVASGAHVLADHAAIGTNGAVIVTWESFTSTCGKYGCAVSSYVLHASRQNPNAGFWTDSGPLMGPDRAAHDGRVALDAAGGAALVAVNSGGAYASATQGNAGGVWSTFKNVAAPQGLTITTGLASDDAGQVTLMYEFIGYPTSQLFAVNGSVSTNTWSSPVVISGSDTSVGQIYFAVSPGGAAAAIWLNSSGTPAVRAILRATGAGTWSSPVTVSGPGSEISPEATAVNSSGSAVVIYSGYDANNVHTEYATNYHR
ncbi:MAG TPA: hypothetical protein VHW09_01875 [Bryobacteraceae bacterium]|jgi:hypothetical protein|nr:hypothetical protein [Bryobacteraceae bacterium]